MSRKKRDLNPSKIHLVTIRTTDSLLFLRPDRELEELIGGIVGRYQEMFGIELYAYNFLGNHYHALTRAPRENLWRFAQNVNRELSRRIKYLRKIRGQFWGRRYDDQIVVEVEDATEAFLYITTNAVHHGLVSHPGDWPGLNSYRHSLNEEPRKFTFTHYTTYSKALKRARRTKELVRIEDHQTIHSITLTPLPEYRELSREQRTSKINPLIEARALRIRTERAKAGKGFLGRLRVLTQNPFHAPKITKRSPSPLCYTKSLSAKNLFMEEYFLRLEAYTEASKRFRAGDLYTDFPAFTIKPPLLYLL